MLYCPYVRWTAVFLAIILVFTEALCGPLIPLPTTKPYVDEKVYGSLSRPPISPSGPSVRLFHSHSIVLHWPEMNFSTITTPNIVTITIESMWNKLTLSPFHLRCRMKKWKVCFQITFPILLVYKIQSKKRLQTNIAGNL